ncbi:hypothetical protein FHS43_000393 [Streptosporangium becharense]|uniref:DNA polymerase III beta sliding clamp central domain-containing protein n=1 Tax=Streptosporangium becharense TaxID=1816182 RepID=A0A7W9IGV9_9ACTN|nr:hypothetical protein [Streptosporangium becharense]MBB2909147.1 hypothetical protein [Streptosporangium becharense]MBB5819834.1 hypothetical protein [Streptosporangium becharense]
MTTQTTATRPGEITLTMTGRELRHFLGAVLPHAGTDPGFPPLTMVTLDAADGHLHALATDRYTLGITRHPLPEPTPGQLTVTVPAAALRAVTRQIAPRADVRLTLTGEGLTIEQLSDPHLTYRLPASTEHPFLPDWRPWLAQRARLAPDPVLTGPRGVALNPAYLARFRAATRDGLPLELRPAGKALFVTCGTHFLGVLMPMDLSQARAATPDPLTGWLPAVPAAVATLGRVAC